ncbi:MAG: radical SAM protein [Candidatus Zixiibacteriota bacterium]|nr:MAG: radical SAM protein [candidate division Zixibacteria bacterium]HDL04196.1 radical SAM protein [candidate division Zixibacteria bacterium]
MHIAGSTGHDELARVYLAETAPGNYVEFVESLQPPFPREEKWVLIISTMYGCPVRCAMCDAGGWYRGKISVEDIFEQIDYPIARRYTDRVIPVSKFKIQFARMGEPSLNDNVLAVLEELPGRYEAPGLMPCISSVAPGNTDAFFERLIDLKSRLYADGRFQLQFSIHSTDEQVRNKLIPIKKWSLSEISEYGRKYFCYGDRKIALNFALAENCPVSPEKIARIFDPEIFVVKFTPVNPTITAENNGLVNSMANKECEKTCRLKESLYGYGFEVIISLGELEENRIGSNCGQYIRRFLESGSKITAAYEYEII